MSNTWRDAFRSWWQMETEDREDNPTAGEYNSAQNAYGAGRDCGRAEMKAETKKLWERFEHRPKIVCLCGSTRFMDAFHEAGWQLTLDGYIVLSVGVCKHAADHGGEALGEDVAEKLDELHLRKIDLADWVLVLNVNGYIGESTRREIEYAKKLNKPVTFLEPEKVGAVTAETPPE